MPGTEVSKLYCKKCYDKEIRYRNNANCTIGFKAFDIPKWDDLKGLK